MDTSPLPAAVAVFGYALITALSTGLGAIPFAFATLTTRWLGMSNAVAAGLMAAASWSLIAEGSQRAASGTWWGVIAGAVFIALSDRFLRGRSFSWGELDRRDAMKILLMLGVMTIHSFTEGVGVGVSFAGGQELGLYITAAMAVHNVPEGLAISLVMVPRGTPVWKAGFWSVFSSLPQPIMAVPAFLLVAVFEPFLAPGLGFAAGAMLWMVASDLLPEAFRDAPPALVAAALLLSMAAMFGFQRLL